jgi:hypothetical protein
MQVVWGQKQTHMQVLAPTKIFSKAHTGLGPIDPPLGLGPQTFGYSSSLKLSFIKFQTPYIPPTTISYVAFQPTTKFILWPAHTPTMQKRILHVLSPLPIVRPKDMGGGMWGFPAHTSQPGRRGR